MSKVKVHRHAAKYLHRLPKDSKERIKDVLKRLEVTPLEQPDVRHMVGEWAGYHRIRVGKLRIIFVDDMAAFHTIQAALIHSGGIPNGDIR